MNSIYCKHHGHQAAAVVCQHLAFDGSMASHQVRDNPDGIDAWCHQCQLLYDQAQQYSAHVEQVVCITATCPICFLSNCVHAEKNPRKWWQFWR